MKRLSLLFNASSKVNNTVMNTLKHLNQLNDANKRNSAIDKLSIDLKMLQLLLYGDLDKDPKLENIQKLQSLLILQMDHLHHHHHQSSSSSSLSSSLSSGQNLIYKLCQHLKDLHFEAKKQAAQIVCFAVRRCHKDHLVEYLQQHQEIFQFLVEGFEDQQLVQHVACILQEMAKRSEIGPMLFDVSCHFKKASNTIVFKSSLQIHSFPFLMMNRENTTKEKNDMNVNNEKTTSIPPSFNHEEKNDLNEHYYYTYKKNSSSHISNCSISGSSSMLLEMPNSNGNDDININLTTTDIITQLLVYSHNPNLIIASDAFEVLSILFNKHETRSRKYLEEHMVQLVAFFNASIMSNNFVTQGKFLKLLQDIILARGNVKIRTYYINQKEHLRLVMTLLKNHSRLISYEAFHLFKIFVINPHKNQEVHIILFKNRDKLLKCLHDFQIQRQETDPEFKREKDIVMNHLKYLSKPKVSSPQVSSPQIFSPQEKKTQK